MLFSIIVPIFNVELYLEKCIKSVLASNYNDYEIILIDDGSTDASGSIADFYSNINNVKVIHQKNRGLSAARNIGIENSNGKYLIFLDGDDFINSNAIEQVAEVIVLNNYPDVVVVEANEVYLDGSVVPKLINKCKTIDVRNGKEFLENAIRDKRYSACSPLYICSRKMINCNRIRFKKGVYHEDELWTPTVLYNAESIVDTMIYLYFHRKREGSITNTPYSEKKAYDIIEVCKELLQMYSYYPTKQSKWARDNIATLYLDAVFIGGEEFTKKENFDRWLPIENAKSTRNIIKSFIFVISPRFYYHLNNTTKRIIHRIS